MTIELEALKKRLFETNSVRNIKFFPGTNLDATPEDYAREINKFFAEAENGDDEFSVDELVYANLRRWIREHPRLAEHMGETE